MGKRGPRPQPVQVAAVKSAVRSKRAPRAVKVDAPVQVAAVPAPAWVKGRALGIWNEKAAMLIQAKLLTAADAGAFGRYCKNFATWLDMREGMDVDGYTYEAESYAAGKGDDAPEKKTVLRRADPRFIIADRLERQLLAAEDRFGLSPAERQRIMVARSTSGYGGGLFPDEPQRRPGDVATPPSAPAQPSDSPVGMLN